MTREHRPLLFMFAVVLAGSYTSFIAGFLLGLAVGA